MRNKLFSLFTIFTLSTTSLLAHSQLMYTPNTALAKGKTIELRHVFTHPFSDEHTMDMGKQHDSLELAPIEEFYVINKGKKKDLKSTLEMITFNGSYDSGKGYASKYKARRMGDHVFVLKPAPYYEDYQNFYIQPIVKMMVNVAGTPTDWDKELGLETEIIPLVKPYSIWEGGTFRGVVKTNNKVLPYAEIDVTYLNRDVDVKNNQMGESRFEAPQDSFIVMSIKANKNGEFTFGVPKAGFWGFIAVGSGTKTEYKGKNLSQDAVIWIEAKEMK